MCVSDVWIASGCAHPISHCGIPSGPRPRVQSPDINTHCIRRISPLTGWSSQHSDPCACPKDEPSWSLNGGSVLEGTTEMGAVLVPCVCHNKLLQTRGLEITDAYSLTGQVAKSLKSWCWFLLGLPGEPNPCVSAGFCGCSDCWRCLGWRCDPPIPASVFTFCSACVCFPSSSLLRVVVKFRAHSNPG